MLPQKGENMMYQSRFDGMKTGRMVCVVGLIGTGKSTLTSMMAKTREGAIGLYEPASKTNPYLAQYYADCAAGLKGGKNCGAMMQIFLLTKRLEQHRYAQAYALAGGSSVSDSTIFSDQCFVSMLEKDGTIEKRDADTYYELLANMSRELLYPSAIVFLDVTPEKALERIAKRMSEKAGRKCEAGIPVEYLRQLRAEYVELLANLQRFTHVIRLDWNDDKTPEQLEDTAKELWQQIDLLHETQPIGCRMGL